MGKWDHRRRFGRGRRHYYRDYNWSPPRDEPLIDPETVVWQDDMPMWEKKFCFSVGRISWDKVLGAKKFWHTHSNVLSWDDSASEEAFNNAKKRFWAEINGRPSDIQLPNPDIYVDDIDWNPYIDPDLIHDLDLSYFNPDEHVEDTAGTAETASGCVDNPWERGDSQNNGPSKDEKPGWNQWDYSVNVQRESNNNDDPWERYHVKNNEPVKSNPWGGTSDWKKQTDVSKNSMSAGNQWRRQGKGWENRGTSSSGWKNNEGGIDNTRHWNNGRPWENGFNQGRGGQRARGSSWGWKQRDEYSTEARNRGVYNGGCRKREGSNQYVARYKGPRLQGSDYQTGRYWRNTSNDKWVSFAS